MTPLSRTISWIGAIGLALTIFSQVWSVPLSPTVWQDEAQVIDIGRGWFEPESRASIWFDPDRAGLPQLSYVGGVIMEAAYRVGGHSFIAPRLLGLWAAVGAALACLVWLRRMGLSVVVAWIAAFWLYLDPAIERSYRGGRVDAIAIALAFAACAVIADNRPGIDRRWRLAAAGAMAALMPWIWISGVLLWPLIGVAVWHAHKSTQPPWTWQSTGLWLAAGALVATLGAAWPVRGDLVTAVSAMAGLLALDASAPNAAAPGTTGVWAGLWASVRYSPWLPFAAAAGVWFGGRSARAIGAVAAVVALIVVGTRPYLYRYVYLVPYLVVLSAFGVEHLRASGRPWQMRVARAVVVVTLLWSAGLAIGYRSWVAFDERAGRDHDHLRNTLAQVVTGTPTVFVDALEVYHAGRSLGWRMYRPTDDRRAGHQDATLPRTDVIIVNEAFNSPARRARFLAAGFDAGTRVEISPGRARIRYGSLPYGPFVVYHRVR